MKCSHRLGRRDWLKMSNGVSKLHPICKRCGAVKNISSDKGRKMSYFIIVLSKLRKNLAERGYKVSEAQLRLITKELSEIDGFDDTWWITYSQQRDIFIKVVQKYLRVPRWVIEKHFPDRCFDKDG